MDYKLAIYTCTYPSNFEQKLEHSRLLCIHYYRTHKELSGSQNAVKKREPFVR